MNDYELIKSIFDNFIVEGNKIPAEYITYTGKGKTYITYTFTDDEPALFAEDQELGSVAYIDVDIFSDRNYLAIEKRIKEVMKEIGLKTKQAQTIANSSKALDPRDVVLKIRVLAGLSTNCTEEELRSFIEMIRTSVEDKNKAWNDAINRKVFEKIGIEFDQELSEKLRLSESKYLSELFISSRDFFRNLNTLINHIKEHPELSIEDALDLLPENQETKRMLEELGIDYHAWTRINKESHTKVEIELNAEQARDAAIKSLAKHQFNPILSVTNYYNEPHETIIEEFKTICKKAGYNIENKNIKINIWHGNNTDYEINSAWDTLDCEYGRILTSKGVYTCPFLANDHRGRCGSNFKDFSHKVLQFFLFL